MKTQSFHAFLLASISFLPVGAAVAAPVLPSRDSRSGANATPRDPATAFALVGCYDLLLYFGNTEPFLDAVGISYRPIPRGFGDPRPPAFDLKGRMEVPRDFNAPLSFREISAERVVFDVLVPRNASRPKDLTFRYETSFRGGDYEHGAGLVQIVAEGDAATSMEPVEPRYVASFLLFKTSPNDPRLFIGNGRSCLRSQNPRPTPESRR